MARWYDFVVPINRQIELASSINSIMVYLRWTLILIHSIIIIGTIVTVLLDNRQPSKTMAWLLVLIFLPIVGITLYFFFGQNTRKQRMMSQRSIDQLTKRSMLESAEQKDLMLSERYRPSIQLFVNQNMSLPLRDNEVEIYIEGADFFLGSLKAMGSTKHHIHIDTYIIEEDPLSRLTADALIDKVWGDIEARLICDYVGCWKVPGRYSGRLRNVGVGVRSFIPVYLPAFTGKVNYRNHRKPAVVDGQVGFIDGIDIVMRYTRGSAKQPWGDMHMKVRGGAVYAVQRTFLVDWYLVDRALISSQKYYPPFEQPITNGCLAQVVISNPISPRPEMMQGYVRILFEARRYVYMETLYFLSMEPVLFAIRTAVLTGVDMRLMLPRHGDVKLIEWASRLYIFIMIGVGVKVYSYKAGFNHSKLLVADGSLCTCGPTNIDLRSFENNFEANIFFYDEELVLRMKQIFLIDQESCVLVDRPADSTCRLFLSKPQESLVHLLAPLL